MAGVGHLPVPGFGEKLKHHIDQLKATLLEEYEAEVAVTSHSAPGAVEMRSSVAPSWAQAFSCASLEKCRTRPALKISQVQRHASPVLTDVVAAAAVATNPQKEAFVAASGDSDSEGEGSLKHSNLIGKIPAEFMTMAGAFLLARDAKELTPTMRWGKLVFGLENPQDKPPEVKALSLKVYDQWSNCEPDVEGVTRDVLRCNSVLKEEAMRVNTRLIDGRSCMQPFIMHPDTAFKAIWTCFGVGFICWDLLTVPLALFEIGSAMQAMIEVMSYASFGFWVIDLLLNFVTGMEMPYGLEFRPKRIAINYLKSWFLPDLVIVLVDVGLKVTELVAANSSDSLSYVRLLRVLRFLRFIRLLRISKVATAAEIFYRHVKSPLLWLLMKIANGLVLILMVNHYLAIAFVAIGLAHQESGTSNWIRFYELTETSFWDQYLTSLHWSLTQFMPATNNIGPVSGDERVFAIFVVIVALAIFSSFVSSITTAVTALRAVKESKARAEAQIRQFFTERDLSAELLTHVRQCYTKKGTSSYRLVETDLQMLEDLPEKTRMRLHKEMFWHTLTEITWMPNNLKMQGNLLLDLICHLAFRERLCTPHDDVFLPDQVSNGLYITKSKDMVYQPSGRSEAEDRVHLHAETRLSEIGLWARWTHRGQLTSQATCHYFGVDAAIFANLVLERGGDIFRYFQVFGFLLVAHVEEVGDESGWGDLPVDEAKLEDLIVRAKSFNALSKNEKNDSITGMWMNHERSNRVTHRHSHTSSTGMTTSTKSLVA